MAPSVDDLLATPTASDIKDLLLARMNVAGFPITDWYSGGFVRTYVESTTALLRDLVAIMVPTIAKGGLLGLATGDWLTVLASQNYLTDRTEPTYTVQSLTLTVTPGAGPYTVSPGDLVAESAAGHRYILAEAGTLSSAAPVVLDFRAESPGGAYNDGAGQITRLVTALAGVTVNNAAAAFSDVSLLGAGLGTLAVSATGTVTPTTVAVRILTSGQKGAATFQYSLQGGPFVSAGVVPSTYYDIPGTNIRLTFSNHATANPSFLAGDRYIFTAPGSPISSQGRDEETDDALTARARARWPALATIETADKYQLWAFAADPQVTKVSVTPSALVPGQVDITIAGAVNPLSGTVATAVQSYIDQRAGITETPAVVVANVTLVTTAGTVLVRADQLAAVQAAAQASWDSYVAAQPIAGTFYASKLYQALMDAGAIDAENILVGGGASLTLPSLNVGQTSGTLAGTLTWTVV